MKFDGVVAREIVDIMDAGRDDLDEMDLERIYKSAPDHLVATVLWEFYYRGKIGLPDATLIEPMFGDYGHENSIRRRRRLLCFAPVEVVARFIATVFMAGDDDDDIDGEGAGDEHGLMFVVQMILRPDVQRSLGRELMLSVASRVHAVHVHAADARRRLLGIQAGDIICISACRTVAHDKGIFTGLDVPDMQSMLLAGVGPYLTADAEKIWDKDGVREWGYARVHALSEIMGRLMAARKRAAPKKVAASASVGKGAAGRRRARKRVRSACDA
jgi:hypothetical protein